MNERREVLKAALAAKKDPHTAVAAWAFGVPEGEVTRAQRQAAKEANYLDLYSQSLSNRIWPSAPVA